MNKSRGPLKNSLKSNNWHSIANIIRLLLENKLNLNKGRLINDITKHSLHKFKNFGN